MRTELWSECCTVYSRLALTLCMCVRVCTAGREGTQTVNITVVCSLKDEEMVVHPSGRDEWAVERYQWVSVREALRLGGQYDKYVSLNLQLAVQKGYLSL